MLRPSEFLDLARRLLQPEERIANDVDLRRSISTSYYALFHTVLTTAAERFVGADPSRQRGYAIVYRAFNHSQMRQVCESLTLPLLSKSLRQQLGRETAHPDLRDFAVVFTELQSRRHQADYDPTTTITFQDARTAFDLAERGIIVFERAPADERADVLALMLAGSRR